MTKMLILYTILLITIQGKAQDVPPFFESDCSLMDFCRNDEDSNQRTCSCDSECHKYALCCQDAENISLMTPDTVEFKCHTDRTQTPVYTKRTCSQTYAGHPSHVTLCVEQEPDKADVLGTSPVSSRKTKITYHNQDCAICNGESKDDLMHWSANVFCPTRHGTVKFSSTHVEKNLLFDADVEDWGLKVQDGFIVCALDFVQPKQLKGQLHYCQPNIISNCSMENKDADFERRCRKYYGQRKHKSSNTFFKNIYCAMCNGVAENELECIPHTHVSVPPTERSGVITVQFRSGEWLDKKSAEDYRCSSGNGWDPFAKRCRKTPPPGPITPTKSFGSRSDSFSAFAFGVISVMILIFYYS